MYSMYLLTNVDNVSQTLARRPPQGRRAPGGCQGFRRGRADGPWHEPSVHQRSILFLIWICVGWFCSLCDDELITSNDYVLISFDQHVLTRMLLLLYRSHPPTCLL